MSFKNHKVYNGFMHIYIAGLGGAGLGPLAEIAHQLGHQISGSDLKNSSSLDKMKSWQPKPLISIGQTAEQIARIHAQNPIDWYIYSSALAWAKPPNAELAWVKTKNIKCSKRDDFLNYLLKEKKLNLLAVAGSHGKTTTTALIIWLFNQLGETISYSLGGKLDNLPAAQIKAKSKWFVYEADEFDRNFLSFHPELSLITGIDHDHPEIYPTKQDYFDAFCEFITQSKQVLISQQDFKKLSLSNSNLLKKIKVIQTSPSKKGLTLAGKVNRENATLALATVKFLKPNTDEKKLITILNRFSGSWRRFEEIAKNLYTDYAHSPVKIAGCLQRAAELKKPVVVIYEPHSNQRQHLVKEQYKNIFNNVKKIYWLPTFLTREDPNLKILTIQDLISTLKNPQKAQEAEMNEDLKNKVCEDLKSGAVVIGISASGLDSWLRSNLADEKYLKF